MLSIATILLWMELIMFPIAVDYLSPNYPDVLKKLNLSLAFHLLGAFIHGKRQMLQLDKSRHLLITKET